MLESVEPSERAAAERRRRVEREIEDGWSGRAHSGLSCPRTTRGLTPTAEEEMVAPGSRDLGKYINNPVDDWKLTACNERIFIGTGCHLPRAEGREFSSQWSLLTVQLTFAFHLHIRNMLQ